MQTWEKIPKGQRIIVQTIYCSSLHGEISEERCNTDKTNSKHEGFGTPGQAIAEWNVDTRYA